MRVVRLEDMMLAHAGSRALEVVCGELAQDEADTVYRENSTLSGAEIVPEMLWEEAPNSITNANTTPRILHTQC